MCNLVGFKYGTVQKKHGTHVTVQGVCFVRFMTIKQCKEAFFLTGTKTSVAKLPTLAKSGNFPNVFLSNATNDKCSDFLW